MNRWIRKHPVAGFVLLTYGISYLLGLPLLMAMLGWIPAGQPLFRTYLSRILVVYGPGLAALVLAHRAGEGRTRATALLRRLVPSWSDVPWALSVMGLGALASASAALLAGVEPDTLRRMLASNAALLLAHFLLQLVIVATGEELGWRGWLLPTLLKRTSRLRAALAVAGVWGLWHAPLLLSSLTTTALFLLGVAGLSILFTWILIHTSQRLFVVIVAHAAVNTPMFFWEQVAPALHGPPGSMQAAWYTLEACYAGVALLLVLANWHWWTARPAAVAEPVAWVAGPGQPAA